jgi:hypothetical protein
MTDGVKEENTFEESKGRSSEPSYRSTIPIWKCIWMYSGGSLVQSMGCAINHKRS